MEPMPTHVHAYFSVDDIQKIEASAAEEILQSAKRLCDEATVPYVSHTRAGAIAQTIAACTVIIAKGPSLACQLPFRAFDQKHHSVQVLRSKNS